jgi:GTP pyrophosphokinase
MIIFAKEMDIQEQYNNLVRSCRCANREIALLNEAFESAKQTLSGQSRENGDPYLCHPLEVARIVVQDIGLQASTAIAVLLHEVRNNRIKHSAVLNPKLLDEEKRRQAKEIENITRRYGEDIAQMVSGMNKISAINLEETKLESDNLRKFILLYSKDPRVTLIKLADRLEVMRALEFFPKSKQEKKATETLLLYAPLAHQLGLYNIKSELEDLSLRYTEPEAYRFISNKLKISTGERQQFMDDFLQPVEKELKKRGLKYEIKSRTKSVYSIWRKMQVQKVDFEGVYDIFAIRIIIDAPADDRIEEERVCWEAYASIDALYEVDTKRLRDWVSNPKASGYEALHSTVTTPQGKTVEVQIRTARMDMIAERGAAAHWKYKGVKSEDNLQSWLDHVRMLLESPNVEYKHYFPNFKSNEIFVFTPTGELRRLPMGASVLDFAFDIHSNIGLKCTGALVNGKNVSIKEKLATGDVVAITTAKNQKPAAAWVDYVITSKARSKIKQKLRDANIKMVTDGKELLERRLKNWKLELSDDMLAALVKHYKLKTISDFYAAIAEQQIDILDVRNILTAEAPTPSDTSATIIAKSAKKPQKASSDADYLLIDEHLSGMGYKLAKCCNPIFGDDVFGFVTINEGVKIHRYSCPNAARLMDKYDYRVVKVKWRETSNATMFDAVIRITGNDESGMLNRINEVISSHSMNIRSMNINNKDGEFDGRIQVLVQSTKQLDKLLYGLRELKGVRKVTRMTV